MLVAYIEEKFVHVGVKRHFPLVFGHLVHLAVKVKVQTGQLLLHLSHVLHLFDGAGVSWEEEEEKEEPFNPPPPASDINLQTLVEPELPNACSFPEWKSLRRLRRPLSISCTSDTSVRKECWMTGAGWTWFWVDLLPTAW